MIHIAGGVLALLSGGVAIGVQAVKGPHRAHVLAGRCFVAGMIILIAAALPLSVIISSPLLFLIGIFSGYLMLVGWRLARNRAGAAEPVDRILDCAMLAGSLAMIVVGILTWSDQGVVLLVFGVLGIPLAGGHLLVLRKGPIRGRLRIGNHLQFMIAAFIATVTAFLVVNGVFGILDWFLPTVLLTPVIVLWKRRILAGGRTTADRPPRRAVATD